MWAMYTVGLHLIATCWTQGRAHDSGMCQEAHYDGSAANRDTLHSWCAPSWPKVRKNSYTLLKNHYRRVSKSGKIFTAIETNS